MKKHFLLTTALWSALLLLIVSHAQAQMPVTLVEIDTVQTLEFHEQITLIGRTEAKIESRLVATVFGQVASIDAAEGVQVAAGHVLLTVNPEPTRLALEAKKAEFTEAKVQVALAASNWERSQNLYEQKLIREIGRDSAHAWLTIAEARKQKAAAERDLLALDLRNCRIRAPFAGYTIRKLVDVGEWVIPGTPVFELVDLSELIVRVYLP